MNQRTVGYPSTSWASCSFSRIHCTVLMASNTAYCTVHTRDSSGDFAMYRFRRFGLKLPIDAFFGRVYGAYFPYMTSLIVLAPKWTVLARKHDV